MDNFYVVHLENFTKDELSHLKNKPKYEHAYVLIIHHELQWFDPGNRISRQWLEFAKILLENEIYNCDFYVTRYFSNHEQKSIEYLNKNSYGWQFYVFDLDIPYGILKEPDLFDRVKDKNKLDIDKCKMKFSHTAFTHRMHRQLFAKFLAREQLIEPNMIAINSSTERKIKKHVKDSTLIQNGGNDEWFYNKNLLNLWSDQEIQYTKHNLIDQNYNRNTHDWLRNSAIHIVSETAFHYPYNFYTEKTTSAILSNRPFIMIGPYKNLYYLRQKGFKTFGNIFDESYDSIKDPNLRFEKIMELVMCLNKKSQKELNLMVENSQKILYHNYDLLLDKIQKNSNQIQKG